MAIETYPVILTKIEEFTSTVRNFHFEFREKPRFNFEPGQFVMVELLKEGKNIRKSYSIASPPHFENRIELCIKKVEGGFTSTWFFSLQEGDKIEVKGPNGVFKLEQPLPERLLFVGTGTGVAPLRAQILHLLNQGDTRPITLVLGVRYENEILFQQELEALSQQHPNFEFIPVISRPEKWTGEKGYVQDLVRKQFADSQNCSVYLCGLVPMVNAMKDTLTELGYPKESIHFEKWT